MKISRHLRIVLTLVIFWSVATYPSVHAQKLSLFIDCRCDRNFIRQELSYADHVRDQALADVQLFIYDIGNGSGGRSYTLDFQGKNTFGELNRQLNYETSPNMTHDEIRKGLVRKIKLGLLHYLLESDLASTIEFTLADIPKQTERGIIEDDPWNNWIFEIYGNADLDKESSREKIDVEFGFESDRVTDNWRIRADLEINHSESRFQSGEEEYLSTRQQHYAQGSMVRSLGSHWSAGIFSGIYHSTYRNLDGAFQFRPAIEFNIFPYREVLRREITFAYKIGYVRNSYIEPTIYGKSSEQLFNHSFDMELRFRQPWGDISTNLEASAYLHDHSKNSVELDSRISIRVFKGLSVRFYANLDLIRDQINLPAGDASIEDILLRQRQIATDFEVSTGIGLSYTFGSAFNNVINTRL